MKTYHSNLFYGSMIKLSSVKEEDAEIMVRWGEDSEYLRNVDTEIAFPKNKEQMITGDTGANQFYFHLRKIDDDMLIGFVSLHSIEWNNRAGMLAIGIGDATNRNKGFGTEALGLILRYAFLELNLDRVGLEVIEYNKGGIKAYERVGFQQEGRKRSVVYRDGMRYDIIVMGILRPEWEILYTQKLHIEV